MNLENKFSEVILLEQINLLHMGEDIDVYHSNLKYVGSSTIEQKCNKDSRSCWEAVLNLFRTNLDERNTLVIYTNVFYFSKEVIFFEINKYRNIY